MIFYELKNTFTKSKVEVQEGLHDTITIEFIRREFPDVILQERGLDEKLVGVYLTVAQIMTAFGERINTEMARSAPVNLVVKSIELFNIGDVSALISQFRSTYFSMVTCYIGESIAVSSKRDQSVTFDSCTLSVPKDIILESLGISLINSTIELTRSITMKTRDMTVMSSTFKFFNTEKAMIEIAALLPTTKPTTCTCSGVVAIGSTKEETGKVFLSSLFEIHDFNEVNCINAKTSNPGNRSLYRVRNCRTVTFINIVAASTQSKAIATRLFMFDKCSDISLDGLSLVNISPAVGRAMIGVNNMTVQSKLSLRNIAMKDGVILAISGDPVNDLTLKTVVCGQVLSSLMNIQNIDIRELVADRIWPDETDPVSIEKGAYSPLFENLAIENSKFSATKGFIARGGVINIVDTTIKGTFCSFIGDTTLQGVYARSKKLHFRSQRLSLTKSFLKGEDMNLQCNNLVLAGSSKKYSTETISAVDTVGEWIDWVEDILKPLKNAK